MDAVPGSLETLLDLAAKDDAAGLGDAPWPPRTKMPLVVVANSRDKNAALAGLERWKS